MSVSSAEKTRRYRANHAHEPGFLEKLRADARAWARANPRRVKHNGLKRHFGISLAQFEAMVEQQAGLCAICVKPMTPGRDTCVDQDHRTGAIRALLCRNCNTRLGRLENDPLVAQATMAYAEVA